MGLSHDYHEKNEQALIPGGHCAQFLNAMACERCSEKSAMVFRLE